MSFSYSSNKNGCRQAVLNTPKGDVKIFSRPLNRPEEDGPEKGRALTWEDRVESSGKRSCGCHFREDTPGGFPGFFFALQQEKRRLGVLSIR